MKTTKEPPAPAPPPPTDFLTAALDYANAGWCVIPLHSVEAGGGCSCRRPDCTSPGKHPRVPDWPSRATTDRDQVGKWWRMWPRANVGLVTGDGLVVVDVDPRNGGLVTLAELEAEHGRFDTRTAETGGGGLHFYFRAPPDLLYPGHLGAGIDLPKMVVAPPSAHASGNGYGWRDPEREVADLPPWLIAAFEEHTRPTPTPLPLNGNGPGAPAGGIPANVQALLGALDPDLPHDAWLRVGMALHDGDPAAGFTLWDDWSAQGEKYPGTAELRKRWGTFKPGGGVTVGTLVKMALEAGYSPPRRVHAPTPADPPGKGTKRGGGEENAPQDTEPANERAGVPASLRLEDFYAHSPTHKYIFRPTRELWPASTVNGRIPLVPDGESQIKANRWLDRNRSVEQMTWAPGHPEIIADRIMAEGGWIPAPGRRVFNLYRPPPEPRTGDPNQAAPWVEHGLRLFGDDFYHMIAWFAQRVQRPQEKTNHALVLIGPQGAGKDSLVAGVREALGAWNTNEIGPEALMGRFNGFLKSVLLRVSEARDMGDIDRYKLHERLKTIIAAPPESLRIDEKNTPEYQIPNVVGVLITSNHTDGIYLPQDDRRHYVVATEMTKDDFTPDYWDELWKWYQGGDGFAHVAAFLRNYPLDHFNPKAPPPKTAAWWSVVDAGRAPEDAEMADLLERLQHPQAVTVEELSTVAQGTFKDWLEERRNRRKIPHRLESAGYVKVLNPDQHTGRWKIDGKNTTVYARRDLSVQERIAAADRLRLGGGDR